MKKPIIVSGKIMETYSGLYAREEGIDDYVGIELPEITNEQLFELRKHPTEVLLKATIKWNGNCFEFIKTFYGIPEDMVAYIHPKEKTGSSELDDLRRCISDLQERIRKLGDELTKRNNEI